MNLPEMQHKIRECTEHNGLMASQEKHHTHTLISVREKTVWQLIRKKLINDTYQKLII